MAATPTKLGDKHPSGGARWPGLFLPSTAMERSDEIAADHCHAGSWIGGAGYGSGHTAARPWARVPARCGPGRDQASSAQDCAGKWKRADASNKGILEGKELDKFRSVLNTVDTNKDGKISQNEFMTACQKGELKNVQL
jgi:hypothetical protein